MKSLQELNETNVTNFVNEAFVDVQSISHVETAAQLLVKKIYETFTTDSKSEVVLGRIFHSFEFQALPFGLQEKATQAIGQAPAANSIFLSLLGTYGDEPAWQDRRESRGHQAIPLTRDSIKKIPMVTRLFQQIGFDLGILLGEDSPGISVLGVEKSYGIFYIKEAQGSLYIPAQDFVAHYGVKSVIGTGTMLPTGDISICILFCRILIDEFAASNIAPLMALFWQKVFPLVEKGFFA